ncbi:hypothetical protein CLOM_g10724 [Closterium sp. NIES-68]|nr:hypothetical protein CLOM_g10724 [Closterium sp. NIES-68]GJP65020.1 hypothetical protein CLOP_g21944 [Closterium sp. NIES-67]GJP65786.1 hypothetical protein CLOP_g22643 [Closterium sp. NIES-67]
MMHPKRGAGFKRVSHGDSLVRALLAALASFLAAAFICVVLILATGASVTIFPVPPVVVAKKAAEAQGGGSAGGAGAAAGEAGGAAAGGSGGANVPFLSDFDLSKPIVGGPETKKQTIDEADFNHGEAVYQMHVAQRSEMMGGSRPKPPYRGWNAGKVKEVFLSPMYPCRRQQKLARRGEAAWWICNVAKIRRNPHPIIYSIGAVSLDFEDVAARKFKATSFIINPFLEARTKAQIAKRGHLRHVSVGVGAANQIEALRKAAPTKEFLTLHTIMKELNHTHIDILKIDCERCEEAVIPDLVQFFGREQAPASQIILEIHQTHHVGRTTEVMFALEDLGYRLFQAEPASSCNTCYHLSFVHEKFVDPQVPYPPV